MAEFQAAPGLPLAVQGVDLRFGGIHALRDVSFDAAAGQVTAVIGPNGAGKILLACRDGYQHGLVATPQALRQRLVAG